MTSTDLVARTEIVDDAARLTLFGTTDPKTTLQRMAECAAALIDVVATRRLSVRIQGKDHLTVEAWTTLGAMVGVYAVVEWTRRNEADDGYLARAVARTLAGQIVGAAECECSRHERNWRNRDAHTLRAMAQTRAISRALRAPLGQIVVLAGYEAASQEEMPPTPDTARPGIVSPKRPT